MAQVPCARPVLTRASVRASLLQVILPDTLATYVEPDIQVLAAFALNGSDEVHTVARLLLQGVIERSTDFTRR